MYNARNPCVIFAFRNKKSRRMWNDFGLFYVDFGDCVYSLVLGFMYKCIYFTTLFFIRH